MECVICLQPQQNLHVCPTCTHAACAPCLDTWASQNPELNGVCTVCRRKSAPMRGHISWRARTRHLSHSRSRVLCCALATCFLFVICLSICFPMWTPKNCSPCYNVTYCTH
jgi:hypothetical protein